MKSYTFVICPVGTLIEQYTSVRPKVGEVFNIRHIDTKDVVQEARVTQVEKVKTRCYLVLAVITASFVEESTP